MNNNFPLRKIAIIGTGYVGATTAFTLMESGLANEIVLVDINEEKSAGEAMDLSDAASFTEPTKIYSGKYNDCKDASIIIYTAGANQKKGESRLELVQKNYIILKDIIPRIMASGTEAIILIVANPVDILTYLALKISGYPENKLFGSGTILDSSRFRYRLSEYCKVNVYNVHAYVIGEHGDSEVLLWSSANIAGLGIDNYCKLRGLKLLDRENITHQVRSAAYEIISKKGATYYAISLALREICESILRNENTILTVSGLIKDIYGINDCCLSLPCVINNKGKGKPISLPLSQEEEKLLQNSAETLKLIIKETRNNLA